MKIRSLLLGSVAAAGLATGGAYAADLGVLTTLDVCDELGLSGLTISSDTNCLQITGEVKYKFTWGDYRDDALRVYTANDFEASSSVPFFASGVNFDGGNGENDWESRFDAWIKFVATANSDFGPAKAVLKLKEVDSQRWEDRDDDGSFDTNIPGWVPTLGAVSSNPSDTAGVVLDEAYVSIGDSTMIIAGKAGTIMKKGDDEPLNWLGLFNSEDVDKGVGWGPWVELADGGHVIQVVSDLGNGVTVAAGLEKLNNTVYSQAGTAVGVISYAGEGISAHATFAAAGVLDGDIEDWGVHAGFAGTFDNFKVVLAGAFSEDDLLGSHWNVLASASATFDIFTIAGSVEAASNEAWDSEDWGAGASLSAEVTEGVTLNLGGRFYHADNGLFDQDTWQIAASVAAAVTESITLTGEVGYVAEDGPAGLSPFVVLEDEIFYGKAKLDWAPGGGYTSSIAASVNTADAYKIETEFKKTFE